MRFPGRGLTRWRLCGGGRGLVLWFEGMRDCYARILELISRLLRHRLIPCLCALS